MTKLKIADLTDILTREALRSADLSKFVGWLAHYAKWVEQARATHQLTKGQGYTRSQQANAKRTLNKAQAEQREMIAAYHAVTKLLLVGAQVTQ